MRSRRGRDAVSTQKFGAVFKNLGQSDIFGQISPPGAAAQRERGSGQRGAGAGTEKERGKERRSSVLGLLLSQGAEWKIQTANKRKEWKNWT